MLQLLDLGEEGFALSYNIASRRYDINHSHTTDDCISQKYSGTNENLNLFAALMVLLVTHTVQQ